MSSTTAVTLPIQACVLPEESRMGFLPAFFGDAFMVVGESLIFHWMTVLSKDYNGGLWNYVTLSNRGFYMAPESAKKYSVCLPGQSSKDDLSPDAAGIVATLFALEQLAGKANTEDFVSQYKLLRAFASQHAESQLILSVIG